MLTTNKEYRLIANRLIKALPEFEDLRVYKPRIAYLSSDEEKTQNRKVVFGKCFKVAKNYEWCCKYDFFIVVYEPNVIDFNNDQIRTLIRHELRHVGVNDEGTEPSFYNVPHDYEDFKEIIEECGLDWAEKEEE